MKKYVILLLLNMFTLSCLADTSINEEKYLIINYSRAFGRGGESMVSLSDLSYKRNYKDKRIESINYYSEVDCSNKISNYIKEEISSDTENGKTFIYYYTPDIYTVYFCIEKNIWNSVYKNEKVIANNIQRKRYVSGEENIYKDLNDFTEKMKKCGLMHKIDADYLPTPETPVICDKYNEENPIPTKKLKDFY